MVETNNNTLVDLQAFGTSSEILDRFLTRGITVWGKPVSEILEDGNLLAQQAKNSEASGLVSVLIEGTLKK